MKKPMKRTRSAAPYSMELQRKRLETSPLPYQRSTRRKDMRHFTTMPAGKMVPVGVAGLLREDEIYKGKMRYSFEMHETAEVLMNAVQVCVKAYFVPMLAMDRFVSMDELNRAYAQQVARDGDTPIDYIETIPFDQSAEFYIKAGIHARDNQPVNSAYLEAYNQIWNFRATNRSPNLELRDRLDKSLAPAFWNHDDFRDIVPTYDQAKIDGEVALTLSNVRLPVEGIYTRGFGTTEYAADNTIGGSNEDFIAKDVYGNEADLSRVTQNWSSAHNQQTFFNVDANGVPQIFSELAGEGVKLSLANLDLARETQTFAKYRERFAGYVDDVDEYIIDMLMQGISVPEQALKQPILLSSSKTVFGQSKRYATDAGNLTESAVNGATYLDVNIRMPKVSTGGVIMVVAEIVPEQLWERRKDPFLHAIRVDDLPNALQDYLDPIKVQKVPNDFVDIDHEEPNEVFGYAGLNHQWMENYPRIGGDFYQVEASADYNENRQRLWAAETSNPTLSQDFYLATELQETVFADTNRDNFECLGVGALMIGGNTQFGPKVIEGSDDYTSVLEQIDTSFPEASDLQAQQTTSD